MENQAKYYFGTFQGKRKSDGVPFYGINILRYNNRFKSYQFKGCYVDEDTYKRVNDMGLANGSSVSTVSDLDGEIVDIKPDSTYKPLNLNQSAR